MPTPNCSEETEDEWMERCMSDDETIEDFPDEDQRAAFCSDLWERECEDTSSLDPINRKIERLKEIGD